MSNAVWNRLLVVHFNNSVPRSKQDRHLGDKLRAELPGIFRLSMIAWRVLRRRGDFAPSCVSDALVAQFRLRSNPPKMFFEECFTADDEAFVTRREVMNEFKNFCSVWGYLGRHSRESVFDELRRQFPYAREEWRDFDERYSIAVVKTVRARAFVGIRFLGLEPNRSCVLDDSVSAALRCQEQAERAAHKAKDAAKRAAKEAGRAAAASKRKLQQATRNRKALEEPKELKGQVVRELRAKEETDRKEREKKRKEKGTELAVESQAVDSVDASPMACDVADVSSEELQKKLLELLGGDES
jgi:hypothetical protein